MKRQQKKRGLLVTLVLAVVLGTSSYAFTASNTIADAGNAGDGNGGTAIGGYTVTAVHHRQCNRAPRSRLRLTERRDEADEGRVVMTRPSSFYEGSRPVGRPLWRR
jgi:hypothetical protein